MKSDRLVLILVLAFAIVVLTIPMGRAPVWEPNNARWILLARDMVEHGHWFMPEIRGVPKEGLYKPQLFAWAIALVSLPAGYVTEFTAAVPSLVSALTGVAAVFAIGWRLWGVRAGMMAGLILTTTLNYFVFAQQLLADVMMTGAMVWALYFLLRIRDDASLRAFSGSLGVSGRRCCAKVRQGSRRSWPPPSRPGSRTAEGACADCVPQWEGSSSRCSRFLGLLRISWAPGRRSSTRW